ncbi:MAG: hypothetical protein JWM47_1230 [Acidimicrobiales bacterium]|nr:hypothetical protein [Acidimicrobiales bacterium]
MCDDAFACWLVRRTGGSDMEAQQVGRRVVLVGAVILSAVGGVTSSTAAPVLGGPYPMPIELVVTASRTEAASGQVIEFSGTGCSPHTHPVEVNLFAGDSPDFVADLPMATGQAYDNVGRDFVVQLGLLHNTGDGTYEPLPEGPYTAVTWCTDGNRYVRSEAEAITVAGVKPSGDLHETIDPFRGIIDLAGGSCAEPSVTLSFYGAGYEYPGDEQGLIAEIVPGEDGRWGYHWDGPTQGPILVEAQCGDATAEGFIYRSIYAEIEYAPPTTVPSTSLPTSTSGPPTSMTIGPAGDADPARDAAPAVPVDAAIALVG